MDSSLDDATPGRAAGLPLAIAALAILIVVIVLVLQARKNRRRPRPETLGGDQLDDGSDGQ